MALKQPQNVIYGIDVIQKKELCYFIQYKTGEQAKLNILNTHVFRLHMSPSGEFPEYPQPDNPKSTVKINNKPISAYGNKAFDNSALVENEYNFIVDVEKIQIFFDKKAGTMKVRDKRSDKEVLRELKPLTYNVKVFTQTLYQNKDEYYFGGGTQNGRFTHKGELINIVNTNDWNDNGVASPSPFYWSSYGYGILRNTWQSGAYNFGKGSEDITQITHNGYDFDAFFFINAQPKDILCDYYELTGKPIFMPEYAFYEAHLNAFNRDYWVKVSPDTRNAILFEDGCYYKCYQPSQMDNKVGILESLNGEKNNYQFSARAMIDRYQRHDLPLGWFIPNDGYGCGYGQTDTLDGDIQNLKDFGDYARNNGVELAVWTESNLEPVDPENPQKGERDLNKEVSVAGVVALKADVAWIGSGYSFGLNEMQKASDTFLKAADNLIRPMIITVDGWAGTQRCAGIWSGDQSGGEWEYIRFHIPTYIGTGLSGQPNVGSDMDGIYRGGERKVNIRDFQWKTFTPIQLNMDGWGWVQKTPFAFDDEATSINRAYLKLKSMLMPYNYTIGYESIHGLPMIRAMFLEFPEDIPAYRKDSQYQFMWGPNILVAPIYNENEDNEGNSIRNGIYLPDNRQIWIDFLSGQKYQGGKIYNNYKSPLWKIPIFIKDGAIIPACNPNNNPQEIKRDQRIFYLYPNGNSEFDVYEDDGISTDYLEKQFSTTHVSMTTSNSNKKGDMQINIKKTEGVYEGIVTERCTQLNIMVSEDVHKIKVAINNDSLLLEKVTTREEFDRQENVFYFDENFVINPYLKDVTMEEVSQKFLLIKIHKINVLECETQIKITGFINKSEVFGEPLQIDENIETPKLNVSEDEITTHSISLIWKKEKNVSTYEIDIDGVLHTNIENNTATFDDLKDNTEYGFKIRSVTKNYISNWSDLVHVATKKDKLKGAIIVKNVTCSLPSETDQQLDNLINGNLSSMWHTKWDESGQICPQKHHYLSLDFDLGDIFEVDQLVYYPRNDAGNGTFLNVQYKTSTNSSIWTDLSQEIVWEHNEKPKIIHLGSLKIRYLTLTVNKTVGNFGSGIAIVFHETIEEK